MEKGRHKAWMMLTKVAMHALDCDAKLTSSPILTEFTKEMQMMLDNAMCDILGARGGGEAATLGAAAGILWGASSTPPLEG